MEHTYTAWLTTQANMTVNGEHCEVNVIEDDPTGGPEPMAATVLPVPAGAVDRDDEAARDAAETELTKAGWETVGEWEQYAHGYTITVRRDEEDGEETTYTAALATASDVVFGDFCDVSVVENGIISYRDGYDGEDIPVCGMTSVVAMDAVETTVRTDADDLSDLEAEADQILQANGWVRVGDWEPSDNAYYAPVERA